MLNQYPEFKNSKIAWIDKIPKHWNATKIKFLLKRIQTGSTPSTGKDEYFDGAIKWFTPGDFKDLKELEDSTRTVSELALIDNEIKVMPKDTVLLVGIGATLGKVAMLSEKASFNQQITGLETNNFLIPDYLYYWFVINRDTITKIANYTTLPIINNQFIRDFYSLVPPIEEQNLIVSFLNERTSEIDSLIAVKEKLIKLLDEQRQSIITEAVTKGLNQNAVMKDSGVEWIGQIPNIWEICKFKKYVLIQEGPGILAKDFRDSGVPLIRISGVKGPYVSLNGCNYLDKTMVKEKWNHFKLNIGDLLISCSASVDIISEVDEKAQGCIAYTGLIKLNTKNQYLTKDYLKYYVQSDAYKAQVELLKTGSTIQHYGPTHMKDFLLLVPELSEQQKIVKHLDGKISGITESINLIEIQIKKIKEYRQSLIYEAVAGKMRDFELVKK
jgi:type I restriction enzyme, S subunit